MIQTYRPKNDRPPLDPILSLQVAMDHRKGAETPMGSASSRSTVASVCFLPTRMDPTSSSIDIEDDDTTSSSEGDELQFRCQSLLQTETRSASDPTRSARQSAAATSLLAGRYLASCHANGECLLWDLQQRKLAQKQFIDSRGAGWMLRRIGDDRFLYQTRDPRGTVSIHTWEHPHDMKASTSTSFDTFSQTFCAATPCYGNPNLLALPSSNDSDAAVRDLRIDPSSTPLAEFSGSGHDVASSTLAGRKHGMLTSLAFSESAPNNSPMSSSSRPMIACGMESGNVFFHDLRMLHQTLPGIKLSDDPVLALDMAPSAGSKPSVVAIAGMAGENLAQKDLPTSEQGTMAILKATLAPSLKVRLRSRLLTCQPSGEGKPGVNLCRFQPGEGRFFAVGGWDQRVRIMDRSSNSQSPLRAILRGHDASVNALDWAPDSEKTGLCATAAADGRINIWRCFSS